MGECTLVILLSWEVGWWAFFAINRCMYATFTVYTERLHAEARWLLSTHIPRQAVCILLVSLDGEPSRVLAVLSNNLCCVVLPYRFGVSCKRVWLAACRVVAMGHRTRYKRKSSRGMGKRWHAALHYSRTVYIPYIINSAIKLTLARFLLIAARQAIHPAYRPRLF